MPRKGSKYGVVRSDYPDRVSYRKAYGTAYQRERRKTPKGKENTRRMNVRAKGITPEQYDYLFTKQGGVCAVCGTTNPGSNNHGPASFCVDHDRACCPTDRCCGKCVRGLLCQRCNRAEGLLNGNAQALADYLNRSRPRLAPLIYLCGPMTGYLDFNRPAFRTAATLVREQGFDVVCPADFAQKGEWEDLMRHAIPQMLSCDRVVLLGEWEKSRGARLEAFIGRELGMKVETLGEFFLSLPTKPFEQVRQECREKYGDISTETVN